MANYKVIIDGEVQDEVFGTYEDAVEYADYLISSWHTGAETLEMSNPGDYPYDPDDAPDYEIVETDEEVADVEHDEDIEYFQAVVNSPGVFDDDGEYERCPNCDHGLHYYDGVKTCPECGPVE